jgi:FxsC-like protein
MQIFVSYAHHDLEADALLERFLNELGGELRALGYHVNLLFRDLDNLRIGQNWSGELAKALSESCLMLAICSQNFLLSEYCPKEFRVFVDRHERAKYAGVPQVDRMIPIFPVLWIPPRSSVPNSISAYQYATARLPESYVQKGMRQLYRLEMNADRSLAISELARDLADALDSPLPPASSPAVLADTNPAWDLTAQAAKRPGHRPAAADRRIRVNLTVAAGGKRELETVRTILSSYGEDALDWCPFSPEAEAPIVIEAQDAARRVNLVCVPRVVDDHLCDWIKAAPDQNEIMLILADPWTLQLSSYAEKLGGVDRLHLGYGALLCIWNGRDEETQQRADELEQTLSEIFATKWDRPPENHMFHGIDSLEQAKKHLDTVLDDLRNLLIRRATRVLSASHDQLRKSAEQAGIDVSSRAVVQGPVRDRE